MGDVVEKPKDISDVVKSRRELLLTRIQSFTCKEASEACREMDEKLLERTARMCEKLANFQIPPTPAVMTVINLSKISKPNSLFRLIDQLENIPAETSRAFVSIEKLSREVSPEKLTHSIPILQKLHEKNQSTKDTALLINEEKFIRALSQFAKVADDEKFRTSMQLGWMCIDRSIQAEELYNALTSIAQKNPTQQQFNKITEELSRIIPTLKLEFETAMGFVTDMPGDEKRFVTNRPEWMLSYIAGNAKEMSLDEFIKFLPTLRREVPKEEFNPSLEEIRSNYVRILPETEMVVVVGRQKYKPDFDRYCELLNYFTKLLDEAKTPDDPKLAKLKEAFSEIYADDYSAEVCGTVFKEWKEKKERWSNKEIAERWIPNQLGVLLSRMCATTGEPEEMRGVREALESRNIPFKVSINPWPKDMNTLIIGTGEIQGYIRNIISETPRSFVGEGGVSVSGPGFTIFSDSVKTNEIEAFKLLHPDIRVYQLPPAYTTMRVPDAMRDKYPNLAGQDILLGTNHIDTVLGIVPKNCMTDEKPLLLIDPRYYKEITENPVSKIEFERLLMEQGLESRLLVIPEEEAYLNPANFAVVTKDEKLLVMNDAKKTINMLLEKGLKEDSLITVHVEEIHAFRGSIGCSITRVTKDEEVITP